MRIPLIAWLTFHEARRRRILWVALALATMFLFVYGFGFLSLWRENGGPDAPSQFMVRDMVSGFTMAGLYSVNFLVVMVSILISVDTISGEISSHTIQSIVTKPIRRWEILLGKWLGFAVIVTAITVFLAAGVIAIGWTISAYLPAAPIAGVGLMILQGLILISLTLLGGTVFSTLTNGVVAVMLYSLAFVGGWAEQIGALVQSKAAVYLGIVSSLLVPTEALWKRAAYLMQGTMFNSVVASPFVSSSVPSPAMVGYAFFYLFLTLGLAMVVLERRDL